MFVTSTNANGSWGIVLEEADGACWLYLCRMVGNEAKITDAIHIASGPLSFATDDVALEWDATESKAALLIKDQVWAVFDTQPDAKYGGDYRPGSASSVPSDVSAQFTKN